MTLEDVLVHLQGDILTPDMRRSTPLSGVFASDLMSDVLAFAHSGTLLLTGLANIHVIRTATLADIAAVIFVQGKRPAHDIIEEARKNALPLATTPFPMFEACARVSTLLDGR